MAERRGWVRSWRHSRKLPVVLAQTDDTQRLMKAVLAQLVMKVEGYRQLAAWAGVTALAAWDLVRDEIGTWSGRDAGGVGGEPTHNSHSTHLGWYRGHPHGLYAVEVYLDTF